MRIYEAGSALCSILYSGYDDITSPVVVFFVMEIVSLEGKPSDLVVKSFLAAAGEICVVPVGQQSVEAPADGFGHLRLQKWMPEGLGF
jgi:hypothetical protein